MNPSELEFLTLLVAAGGDIERTKTTYERGVYMDMALHAGYTIDKIDSIDPDLAEAFKATAQKKLKAMLPAIGNSLIEYGRGLGGRMRAKTIKEL